MRYPISPYKSWNNSDVLAGKVHNMEVHVVADAHLSSHIEEDGDDTILQMGERPNTALRLGCYCSKITARILFSCTLYIRKFSFRRTPCSKDDDQHHHQEWKSELIAADV
nr:hypothetical protein [uncultured Prevotella sp.]